MVTKTTAIKNFLVASTHEDIAKIYDPNIECQVNAAQDNGERVQGDFKGRKWHGWTDGIQTWKSFRIPWKAKSNPEYTDSEIKWNLEEHCDAIGLTGWDWKNKLSRWVAFDFDSMVGHAEGLSNDELINVREAACDIPWVTVRKSTSGKGLHLYIFLEPTTTSNHTEHAALARAILGTMCALTGFDFESKVDACGGNMWVWHRKMKDTDGLTLIKQGELLTDMPVNWRDHIDVINGKKRRALPQNVEETFEELAGQKPKVKLDEDHRQLIDCLKELEALWWWDQDYHMLVTHTYYVQKAHEELGLKGIFKTNTLATELN